MRRILIRFVCAAAFTSAMVHAQQPPAVKEGLVEKEARQRQPVKSTEARAAEAKVVEQRHCSNDASPEEVQSRAAPVSRDPLLRFPAEQKAALKQALAPGRWSPEPASPEKVREKAKVPPELDQGY